jgi:hypothetical protein
VNEATTSAVDEALIYIVEFSSRNEELQTPWRTRAKHKKEHGHGDDKDCTLMPWHMSVKHGVILYTRRRNAVSWRSSRVNLSRACGCAITIFGIACALEFKPRHWNKWSKNLVAFVRQKRIKIKLMSWRLCLKCSWWNFRICQELEYDLKKKNHRDCSWESTFATTCSNGTRWFTGRNDAT